MNSLVHKTVTDASMSYKLANFVNITIGANNIGNTYPDKQKNFANTGEGRFIIAVLLHSLVLMAVIIIHHWYLNCTI